MCLPPFVSKKWLNSHFFEVLHSVTVCGFAAHSDGVQGRFFASEERPPARQSHAIRFQSADGESLSASWGSGSVKAQ